MKSRMRNLLKSRRGQFFILSTFTIVSILYIVSRWVEPFTIVDTSSAALQDAPFIFNNIVEKLILTINSSKSCDDLTNNLDEYINFVNKFALEKSYVININCQILSCPVLPPSASVSCPSIYFRSPTVYINRTIPTFVKQFP